MYEFLKDYANRKKGDKVPLNPVLGGKLKAAKIVKEVSTSPSNKDASKKVSSNKAKK